MFDVGRSMFDVQSFQGSEPTMFHTKGSKIRGSARSPAKKPAGPTKKESLARAVVGSATVPTGIGGHGGPPYFTKKASNFMKFHKCGSAIHAWSPKIHIFYRFDKKYL